MPHKYCLNNNSILPKMKTVIYILIFSISCIGCKPMEERILGTYDIDPNLGCSNCV
jgi:hypothetical protein